MNGKTGKIALSMFFLFLVSGCTGYFAPETKPRDVSQCHIVFDAGSSGTRLYVYERLDTGWMEREGPKVSALADPVREIRGKTWKDADAVTDEVVEALDGMKQNGKAFDWDARRVVSAKVYATAGMRIAEQENRGRSAALWKMLKEKLEKKLEKKFPYPVDADVRTLSGYEEGLYAWLAVREEEKDRDFGIVEMGGASSQVTFPCSKCDSGNDAVKTIIVGGKPLQIYSYSFLGLGQDEAPKSLGLPESCAYGAGTVQAGWKPKSCADRIVIGDARGVRDPYNYSGKTRGARNDVRKPIQNADAGKWILTGAFNYMKESNVDTCCRNKGKCYNEKNSCFQAVYLKKYLRELNVSYSSEKMKASWTLGAVVCSADDCLQKATPPPVCRWSDKGCLAIE